MSVVLNIFQAVLSDERLSVVVGVDKVEVNVRVAAFCLHMRPDHIFLGKTKMKCPMDMDKL